MKERIFSVLGGDTRSFFVANCLARAGYSVRVFGLKSADEFLPQISLCKTLSETITGADIILLPIPATTDGKLLSAPFHHSPVLLNDLCQQIKPHQKVFGGKLPDWFLKQLQLQGTFVFDYADREEFAVLNAISTAEGAIEIAMRELPVTINGTSCLVVGFGRIAKVLCRYLSSFGAIVTASARKPQDFSWMKAFGYHPVHTNALEEHIEAFRVIFNTVPHPVLSKNILKKLSPDSLIIDLASKPGGTDFEAAKDLEVKAIHALSLPGKASPETAGNVICETILNMLKEQEVKE